MADSLQLIQTMVSPIGSGNPADTRRWINVGLTLVHRLRRGIKVKPTLIQYLVSAGESP